MTTHHTATALKTTCVGCGWLFASFIAYAQPTAGPGQEPRVIATDLTVRAGATYTDNLGRDELDEEDVSGVVGADLNVARSLARLDFSANGSVDYQMYDSSRFDNETVGSVDASLTGKIVPEVFHWIAENSFGQARSDFRQAAGPGNRENFNRFATGPDFFVPLNQRTRFTGSGRYEDRSFEDSNRVDSDALSGTMGVTRELSQVQQIGLFGSARRVEFDDSPDSEQDVFGVFVNYQRTFAAGSVSLDLGGNRFETSTANEDGLLFRLSFNRALSQRTTVSLNAGREFDDVGSGLGGRNVRLQDDTGELILEPDPMTRDRIALGITRTGDRLTWRGGVGWNEQQFETGSRVDREAWSATTGVGWRVSPVLNMNVDAEFRREQFTGDADENDELRVSFDLTRDLGRRFGLALRYDYRERSGGGVTNFDENRVSLFLTFTPRSERRNR